MKNWLVSDTHVFHENIIKLCHRPFSNVQEMNQKLIENWNSVVNEEDTVYHLGDFAFRHAKGTIGDIFKQLKGKKHLIIGNHDNEEVINLPWESTSLIKEIKLDGKKLVLCHYPMRSWNGMYKGAIHLYGHEHGNILDYSNCCDVGVDKWNFFPVTLDQILQRMEKLVPWTAKVSYLSTGAVNLDMPLSE